MRSNECQEGTVSVQFDREAALARVGGDLELLQEIAGLFLEDEPNMVAAIEQAAAASDAKGLERSAHTLKGCVSNFGAQHCFDAALHLERLGRAADFSGVPEGMERLRVTLDELRPELRALGRREVAFPWPLSPVWYISVSSSIMTPTLPADIVCAYSPDSDDAFMFYGLATKKIRSKLVNFRHVLSDIQTLNRKATEGVYELTAISYHAYAYVADKYLLMASGSSVGDGYGPAGELAPGGAGGSQRQAHRRSRHHDLGLPRPAPVSAGL